MNNKLNILLTIVILILISYIIYDKYNEKENKTQDVSTSVIENKDLDDVKYYTFNKDIKDDKEENRVYKSVYLFGDNTYYYSFSKHADKCNYWSKGKYTYNANKLILNETSHGGCDTCYYTNNLKTYTFSINKDTLISNDNEMLTLSKADILPVIDIESLEGVKLCN